MPMNIFRNRITISKCKILIINALRIGLYNHDKINFCLMNWLKNYQNAIAFNITY